TVLVRAVSPRPFVVIFPFLLVVRVPSSATLFPYTTLFRSGVPPSRLDPVVGCGGTLEEELVEDGVSIGIGCAGGPYDGSAGVLRSGERRVGEEWCWRRVSRYCTTDRRVRRVLSGSSLEVTR